MHLCPVYQSMHDTVSSCFPLTTILSLSFRRMQCSEARLRSVRHLPSEPKIQSLVALIFGGPQII